MTPSNTQSLNIIKFHKDDLEATTTSRGETLSKTVSFLKID